MHRRRVARGPRRAIAAPRPEADARYDRRRDNQRDQYPGDGRRAALAVLPEMRMLFADDFSACVTRNVMSAAEHADDHDEGTLHQAGWVYFATYGACLGFFALIMLAKAEFFPAAAIVWLTIASIPFQVYLAKAEWMYVGASLAVAAAGYFGLQVLLT